MHVIVVAGVNVPEIREEMVGDGGGDGEDGGVVFIEKSAGEAFPVCSFPALQKQAHKHTHPNTHEHMHTQTLT